MEKKKGVKNIRRGGSCDAATQKAATSLPFIFCRRYRWGVIAAGAVIQCECNLHALHLHLKKKCLLLSRVLQEHLIPIHDAGGRKGGEGGTQRRHLSAGQQSCLMFPGECGGHARGGVRMRTTTARANRASDARSAAPFALPLENVHVRGDAAERSGKSCLSAVSVLTQSSAHMPHFCLCCG